MTHTQRSRPNRYNAARDHEDARLRAQAVRTPRIRWTGPVGRSVPLVSVLRWAGVLVLVAATYAYLPALLRWL